jgi:mannonate dehydratase
MKETDPENIKLSHQISWKATDDEMLFFQQIGIRWAQMHWGTEPPAMDGISAFQKRLSEHDIQIYSGRHDAYHSTKIQLGQAGRDEDIETYGEFIRILGELGIPVAVYDFHPGNTYSTDRVVRRGYSARVFDLEDFKKKVEKQRYDRTYTTEEIWENYTYFVNAVLPQAEASDVILALHPDDPPLETMNGVGKMITHYNGYKRAEEVSSGSKHWGLLFCVGTWSEGGDQMGKDVFEMIEDFGGRGKIAQIHFRNVSAPLPHFEETYPDDGYMDMSKVMNALRQVGFSGAVMPDHIPQLVGDENSRAGLAYCISYMRALLQRANDDIG